MVIADLTSRVITWELLPPDFQLDEDPVENSGHPLIAGALRESLELSGFIQPMMLIASNFAVCATLDGNLVIKAPDWLYVPSVLSVTTAVDRRSYTPHLEGQIPAVAMEFLSATEGDEYSAKPTYPPGKWFFYEQILQIPSYVIFNSATGHLEVYELEESRYRLAIPDASGHYEIPEINYRLGVWQGEKESRNGYWLRWWDGSGEMLPWAVEQIEQERQRAEQERQRAEQERQRAERLEAYLRSQGVDPNTI